MVGNCFSEKNNGKLETPVCSFNKNICQKVSTLCIKGWGGNDSCPADKCNLDRERDKEMQSRAEGTVSGRLEGVTPRLRLERRESSLG